MTNTQIEEAMGFVEGKGENPPMKGESSHVMPRPGIKPTTPEVRGEHTTATPPLDNYN